MRGRHDYEKHLPETATASNYQLLSRAYHGPFSYLACLDLTRLEFYETPQTQIELAIRQQPPKSLFFCLPEGRRVGREEGREREREGGREEGRRRRWKEGRGGREVLQITQNIPLIN